MAVSLGVRTAENLVWMMAEQLAVLLERSLVVWSVVPKVVEWVHKTAVNLEHALVVLLGVKMVERWVLLKVWKMVVLLEKSLVASSAVLKVFYLVALRVANSGNGWAVKLDVKMAGR